MFCLFEIKHFRKEDFSKYWIFISFYIYSILSLIYTQDILYSLKYLSLYSSFLVFPFVFSVLKLDKQKFKKLFKIMILWLLLLIAYSEFQTLYQIYLDGESLYVFFRKDYSYINLGNKINVHPPNMVLIISFFYFYLIAYPNTTGFFRWQEYLIVFIFFAYSVHLSSRTPIVAIILITIILLYKRIFERKGHIKAVLFTSICLALVFTLLVSIRSTRYRFLELTGMKYGNGTYVEILPSKFDQWQSAFKANNSILFGNGLGDAQASIIQSNSENGLFKFAELRYNAHNQYIQTFVGLGACGVIFLFLMLSIPLMNIKNMFSIVFICFSGYLLIVWLSESYLERHRGTIYIVLMLCLCKHLSLRNKN